MPGRNFNSQDYRYGFNGQLKDDEIKGSGNSLEFKFRIYDSRLGRFLSVDPLAKSYPHLSTYQFAGNGPIFNIDLEGLEPFPSIVKFHRMQQKTELVVQGATNVIFGTVGAIGSGVYMYGTAGAGAAVGGAAAMALSLGEVSIGLAQITSAIASDDPSAILHNSSSLPGLVAYGTGSSSAPVIDALGQFVPGMLSGGNVKGLVEGVQGTVEAAKSVDAVGTVYNGLSALDAGLDIAGLITAEPDKAPSPLLNKAAEPKSPKVPEWAPADIKTESSEEKK